VALGQCLHPVDLLGERTAVGDDDPWRWSLPGPARSICSRVRTASSMVSGLFAGDLGERAEHRDVGVGLEEHGARK
jgi:hypothetical protein